MKYRASVMTMTYPRHADIYFESKAKTHDGILRALGKAIAKEVRDDAIAVNSLFVENPDSTLKFMKKIPLSSGDEHQVFLYTKDALFDLMY